MQSDIYNPTRRHFLSGLMLSPFLYSGFSFGERPDSGQRIACLEWLPVEMTFALGLTPVGVTDKRNYNAWVGTPELPQGVMELGLRTEPNMELLQQLKPSVILMTDGFGPDKANLEKIAPVFGVSVYDGSGEPLQQAKASLLRLAQYLDLEKAAHLHLNYFESELQDTRRRMFPYHGEPVLIMSLLDPRHALVFGRHSLFEDVLHEVGMTNAWPGETNYWGSAIVSLDRLASLDDVNVLCFSHGDVLTDEKVMLNPVWKALPFVRENRVRYLPQIWFYGATPAAMRFCRLLKLTFGYKERL